MTTPLNNTFHSAILFFGLLFLPFLGFAQQEQPKRVSIVVSAKEIAPTKEIVQLPADNLPKVVGKAAATVPLKTKPKPTDQKTAKVKAPVLKEKKTVKTDEVAKNLSKEVTKKPSSLNTPISNKTTIKKEEITKIKPVTTEKTAPPKKVMAPIKTTDLKEKTIVKAVKAPTTVKNTKEAPATNSATPSKPTARGTTAAISKTKSTEVEKQKTPNVPVAQQTVPALASTKAKPAELSANKTPTKTSDKTTIAVKADNKSTEVLENPINVQASAFSYIWIGAFLIIAGIVLGLLFGKPAFLISFVGIVFIILGFVI